MKNANEEANPKPSPTVLILLEFSDHAKTCIPCDHYFGAADTMTFNDWIGLVDNLSCATGKEFVLRMIASKNEGGKLN
jgi:hypothetical protein